MFNIYFLLILTLLKNISASYFAEIEKCKITTHGKEYIGIINKTKNGKPCLYWTKEYINQLHLDEINYFDPFSIIGNNFCRNPTNFPNGPWCIIDEETLEWEYCNIPSCIKDRNWCKDTEAGEEYIGQLNYTISDKSCKPWINQKRKSDNSFPEKSLIKAENKCRNPDNAQSPWCYYTDDYKWEKCNVPKCDATFSQIEYFGGYNFLKSIPDQINVISMNNVYHNMTLIISINTNLWSLDVRKKTSLWATDYDPKCQTDLDEYEYCQLYKSEDTDTEYILTYYCVRPLKYLIFISPLTKLQYKIVHYSGKLFDVIVNPSKEFLQYQEKINEYLNKKSKDDDLTIPITENHGYFFLLEDNVIPYATTSQNKVVMTISTIGKGYIAFLASEKYVSTDFHSNLKDLFQVVYNKVEAIPEKLTKSLLKKLHSQNQSGEELSTLVIWNAHRLLGHTAIKLLLDLIKAGLRIIVGIKPWAYNHYRQNLLNSELKLLFLASGIWPSLDTLNENLKVINKNVINTFPLVHLLDYAKTSLLNAINVSDAITNTLLEVPFQDFVNEKNFSTINDNIQALFPIHLPQAKCLIPCLEKPLTTKNDKAIIGILNALLISPFGNRFIAPGLSFYPGKIQSNDIQLITVRMKLNLKFENEVVQLGLYILPGEEASVKITKSKSQQCTLYVNFHLFNVINKNEWKKWPVTRTTFLIESNKLKTFSFSFGGLLSISCKENDDKVDIIFTGVIQIPLFDRRNSENNKNWIELQKLSSPWAILASDSVVFVVSSNTIRNLAQPNIVLEMFDSMIKEQFHLIEKSVITSRREVISTDIQIKAGYMHAGYPIGAMIYHVTNPSVTNDFLFSKYHIEINGEWGLLHEVGHNLQDQLFTFDGVAEVTNNIFTLVAIESMTQQNSWSPTNGWLSSRYNVKNMVLYINNGTFSDWKKDPFLGLGIYAQLKSSFGWEFYAQVFRRYNVLSKNKTKITDAEKIQLWIKETSVHATMNLCPLYDLWKWPIEEETNEELSKLPMFLPDDFLTKMVETRTAEIIKKYGGSALINREPFKISEVIGPLKNKLIIEGVKIIDEIQILD